MFKSQSAWSDLKWKEIVRVRDIGSRFMETLRKFHICGKAEMSEVLDRLNTTYDLGIYVL